MSHYIEEGYYSFDPSEELLSVENPPSQEPPPFLRQCGYHDERFISSYSLAEPANGVYNLGTATGFLEPPAFPRSLDDLQHEDMLPMDVLQDSLTHQFGTIDQILPPWMVHAEGDLMIRSGTTDSGYAEEQVSIDDSVESLNRILGLCPLCTYCVQASLVNAPTSSIANEVQGHIRVHHRNINADMWCEPSVFCDEKNAQLKQFCSSIRGMETSGKETQLILTLCPFCYASISSNSGRPQVVKARLEQHVLYDCKDNQSRQKGYCAKCEKNFTRPEILRGHHKNCVAAMYILAFDSAGGSPTEEVNDSTSTYGSALPEFDTHREDTPIAYIPFQSSSPEDTSSLESPGDTTSPGSSESECDMESLIIQKKHELLDDLMDEFYRMCDGSRLVVCGSSNSPSSQGDEYTNAITASMSSTSSLKPKRALNDGNEQCENNDDDEAPPRKRPSRKDKAIESDIETRKLACPFFKNNRQRYYGYRVCCGPGWESVHRVKEHVYRRHMQPPHCERCFKIFDNENVRKEHARAKVACEPKENVRIVGIDQEQEKRLRSRKRVPSIETEEQKWMKMYRIIFPEADANAVTPYYDYDHDLISESRLGDSPQSAAFARYEDYLAQELPRRLRTELEHRIDQELHPLSADLRGQLVEIVRDLQQDIFRSYQQTQPNSQVEAADPPGNLDQNPDVGPAAYAYTLTPFSAPPQQEAQLSISQFDCPPVSQSMLGGQAHASDSGYGTNSEQQVNFHESLTNMKYSPIPAAYTDVSVGLDQQALIDCVPDEESTFDLETVLDPVLFDITDSLRYDIPFFQGDSSMLFPLQGTLDCRAGFGTESSSHGDNVNVTE